MKLWGTCLGYFQKLKPLFCCLARISWKHKTREPKRKVTRTIKVSEHINLKVETIKKTHVYKSLLKIKASFEKIILFLTFPNTD